MYIFSYDRRTDVSAQNIDLSGNLDVSGSSTLSTLNVSGLATFSGGISAEGLTIADSTGNITIQNTDPSIILKTSSNVAGKIIFGNTSHGVGRGVNISTLTDANDVVLHTTGSGSVGLVTNSLERMRINNTGNVGIGKTNPTSTLDVNGTLGVSGTTTLGNVTLKAAATSSAVSHVPVFISDPATNAQTLVTRTPADFRVQIGALNQVNLGFANGTTAGPTITNSGGTNVVIPSATSGESGVVTTAAQTFAGDKTFSGNISIKAATTTSVPNAIPVFTSSPSGTAQQIVTRTPAQLLSDISGVSSLNAQTIAGTKTFSSTIVGSINGNANTVTNGVYTTGNQTIGGTKTFSSTISGSITGNAGSVTNGVYTSGDQTIGGNKTFTGNTSMTGKVGMGGAVSTEQLKVYGDLKVTGNIDVDGSFNFKEIVQTTINNTVLVSSQLDISNQGTGPALKVSQLGSGDGQDVALFNAGSEGDALKIDSSGKSHFYKDVDISGTVNVVGDASNNPIMTITNNHQLFDTIVLRRINTGVNRWNGISEIQLWVNGANVMPSLLTQSTFKTEGTPLENIPNIPFFINWSNKTLDENQLDFYPSNIANESIDRADGAVGSAYWGINTTEKNVNVGLYIPLTSSLNVYEVQSLVLYTRTGPTHLSMSVGARFELYNRANDPTLLTPVTYTNIITTEGNKYRFDFPAISTYNSFVDLDASTTNIISTATNSSDINYTRTGLKIENANLDVDCSIITNNIKMSNDIDSFLDTLPSTYSQNSYNTFGSFSGTSKWYGGVLAPNGKIYGIPHDSTTILEIDPINQTATTFGSFSGNDKWFGGVLAPNGKIYGIPRDSTTILEIDPINQTATTFGSFSGTGKWYGGVLAPNGKIYGIPNNSTTILEIDPINQTATTFGSFSGDDKWLGGVLAPNGKIYGIPNNSTTILEIDPINQTATTFGSFSGTGKWYGGVLAPNGKIYGIPHDSTTILEIDPINQTATTFGSFSGNDKWFGGVLAPNGKIYGIPRDSTTILEIDPINQTATTFGSLSGTGKWYGGVLAPNGKIYGIPVNSTTILEIVPSRKYDIDVVPQWMLEAYFNKF